MYIPGGNKRVPEVMHARSCLHNDHAVLLGSRLLNVPDKFRGLQRLMGIVAVVKGNIPTHVALWELCAHDLRAAGIDGDLLFPMPVLRSCLCIIRNLLLTHHSLFSVNCQSPCRGVQLTLKTPNNNVARALKKKSCVQFPMLSTHKFESAAI